MKRCVKNTIEQNVLSASLNGSDEMQNKEWKDYIRSDEILATVEPRQVLDAIWEGFEVGLIIMCNEGNDHE